MINQIVCGVAGLISVGLLSKAFINYGIKQMALGKGFIKLSDSAYTEHKQMLYAEPKFREILEEYPNVDPEVITKYTTNQMIQKAFPVQKYLGFGIGFGAISICIKLMKPFDLISSSLSSS